MALFFLFVLDISGMRTVLRIRYAHPWFRILIFVHPASLIPDLSTTTEGEGKYKLFLTFFVATDFTTLKNILFLNRYRKNSWLGTSSINNFVIRNFIIRNFVVRNPVIMNFVIRTFLLVPLSQLSFHELHCFIRKLPFCWRLYRGFYATLELFQLTLGIFLLMSYKNCAYIELRFTL